MSEREQVNDVFIKYEPVGEVINRQGEKVKFNDLRILNAVLKAGRASGEFSEVEANRITSMVVRMVNYKFQGSTPTIEDIQDMVEEALVMAGYLDTARRYIKYREKRREAREAKKALIEAISTVTEYVEKSDWRVNANANQGYSLGGLILNTAGKVIANYWLNKIYPERWAKHILRGIITYTTLIC